VFGILILRKKISPRNRTQQGLTEERTIWQQEPSLLLFSLLDYFLVFTMRYPIIATSFALLLGATVAVEGQVEHEGPLRAKLMVRAQRSNWVEPKRSDRAVMHFSPPSWCCQLP
jgi:predicted benzoate:H+ symporter BenE